MTDIAPSAQAPVTAALLIIGDEILSGRTKDANLPYLAEWLNGQGIQLAEARVVPDVEEEIVAALNALRARYAYVFTTGGIGPTHDDITAQSVARAFDVPLDRHEEAVARLSAHYKTAEELTEARLRMANVPRGGVLIDNPVSAAPGFRIDNVFVLAGVPKIMQAMLDTLIGTLEGGRSMLSRTVAAEGVAESRLAPDLARIEHAHPGISIGSYPKWLPGGGFGVSIVLRGFEAAVLDTAAAEVAEAMRALGGEPTREG
jgi:molybdenum cofactor synthesis domain-containing protein